MNSTHYCIPNCSVEQPFLLYVLITYGLHRCCYRILPKKFSRNIILPCFIFITSDVYCIARHTVSSIYDPALINRNIIWCFCISFFVWRENRLFAQFLWINKRFTFKKMRFILHWNGTKKTFVIDIIGILNVKKNNLQKGNAFQRWKMFDGENGNHKKHCSIWGIVYVNNKSGHFAGRILCSFLMPKLGPYNRIKSKLKNKCNFFSRRTA